MVGHIKVKNGSCTWQLILAHDFFIQREILRYNQPTFTPVSLCGEDADMKTRYIVSVNVYAQNQQKEFVIIYKNLANRNLPLNV
jgi:hypothetical protein